jgi:hypothetical protein
MKDLILEEKTGFRSTMPFTIYDNKGVLFYDDTFTDHIYKGLALEFNLPAGYYKFEGSFIKLDSPVKQVDIALPPKERNLIQKKYKIMYGDNPHKCTIFYAPGIILFDNSFKTAPLYIRYGIYFHELGHLFYKSEDKADAYSAKKMLEIGFNPSQIGRVGLMTLSNNSFERKVKTVRLLTKNRKRK